MFTMPAVRHCAAGLAVALVAALLVTLGGHPGMSSPRPTTGSVDAGGWVKPARLPQAVTAGSHSQALPHIDLVATLTVAAPQLRRSAASAAPRAVAPTPDRDSVAATGRAPPPR